MSPALTVRLGIDKLIDVLVLVGVVVLGWTKVEVTAAVVDVFDCVVTVVLALYPLHPEINTVAAHMARRAVPNVVFLISSFLTY